MARVKGTIMLPLVKGVRAAMPHARAELPPHLQRYLDERVIVSEWYPEEDHLELLQLMGRATGVASFVPMGHYLAQFELGGVYKLSLHKGDAMRTLRSFVKLWPQNHDTGTLELAERRGGVTYTLTDYALPAREICEIVTGYVIEGVRMAIERTVRVAHTQCRASGKPACVWEIDLPFVPASLPPPTGGT